jgi:hypothetical protein
VEALARRAVEVAAPEEAVLFQLSANAYFADPTKAIKSAKATSDDEMLGFGVEVADAVPMVTTVALWVAHEVLVSIGGQVRSSLKEESAGFFRSVIRRFFARLGRRKSRGRDHVQEQGATTALSSEQLARIRTLAYDRAAELLPASQARAVADGIVAELATAPASDE